VPLIQFLIGGFIFAVVVSVVMDRFGGQQPPVVQTMIAFGLGGLVTWFMAMGYVSARRLRMEQTAVGAVDELIQLRRWPEAGLLLQSMLSRPARSPVARAQSLLYLAMVLARYHRFEDSVKVHEYILEDIPLDDSTDHAVRLGRAMALLREDHLLDADRAIAELRRTSRGIESAGLALVEIYRDVKTGHAAEAIEMFESHLAVMRRQLGHRVADAWALVARAYDFLERKEDAQKAYDNAMILLPLGELLRRYPEIKPLTEKYAAATAPAEVA
jgi:tetratricopeptide (TPR) repeat protein